MKEGALWCEGLVWGSRGLGRRLVFGWLLGICVVLALCGGHGMIPAS